MSLVNKAGNSSSIFSSIPIIDLEGAASQDLNVRKKLAETIRDACINCGFFYVKNHGISQEIIDEAISAAQEYFSLPFETKMKLDIISAGGIRGYQRIMGSKNNLDSDGDYHEGFEFGYEELETSDPPKNQDGKRGIEGSNAWPEEVPRFRTAMLKYYHAGIALGRRLFPLFALALDLPEDFFNDKTKKSAALMRMLHYPPQLPPITDKLHGIGAHTDWEIFTMLYQQPGIQALQVMNLNKEWIDAPPIPGTLVVNLGDQLSRWTNDIFQSTLHRAINVSPVDRYSIPLFFGVDYDVRLEPIPTCISPERPYKYEVMSAGELVQARSKATYGHY